MAGFVVIEGIDGCGKSSVARALAERIGRRAFLTREPTNSWIGRAVHVGDKRSISPYTDALLFMADRAQHTEEIAKLVKKGKLVVCDRYYHSTIAYQAACLEKVFRGDAFKWLLEANLKISRRPDLTVLLVIPPELGLARVKGRSSLSRFEKLGFLKKVSKNYLKLARVDRSIVKVDGTRALDVVVDEVYGLVKERKL
ncbi:MAG: dTMP kinase [Thermoplasmata archaeon]|nr:dTMP kinase [Thermoplasmata archaeon]